MVHAPGILSFADFIQYTLPVLFEGVYSPYTRVCECEWHLLGFAIPFQDALENFL